MTSELQANEIISEVVCAGPKNGICWDDGNIAYGSLFQTLAEATANFTNLFAKGTDKCKFLTELLGRSIQNLDSFGCPERKEFKMTTGCSLPCHKYPDKFVRLVTRIIFTDG